MTIWTDGDHLNFDVAFALKELKVRGVKHMDEMQRKIAAEQIIAHLRLCGWSFEHPKSERRVG